MRRLPEHRIRAWQADLERAQIIVLAVREDQRQAYYEAKGGRCSDLAVCLKYSSGVLRMVTLADAAISGLLRGERRRAGVLSLVRDTVAS